MARGKRVAAEPLPAGLTPEILDQLVAGVQTSADFQTVLMLYARGLSTRELQAFLEERY